MPSSPGSRVFFSLSLCFSARLSISRPDLFPEKQIHPEAPQQWDEVDTGGRSKVAVDVVKILIFEHFNEIIEPQIKLGVFLDL